MYKLYHDERDWNSSNNNQNEDVSIVRQQPAMNSIRLAVLGDYGVGKTTLIRRLCHSEFNIAHEMTTKVDLYSTTISTNKGDRRVKLELYDTPGRMDQCKENVGRFCHSCHGAILVYDTTEQYSFQNIPDRIASVRRSLPPYAELFMIGTKCDSSEHRKVPFKEADVFATKNNLSLFETSSKSGSGVSEAFSRIAESVLQRYEIGTFDPSTWIVPASSKGQPAPVGESSINRTMNGPTRLNWPFMCCWF